ncbi:MAG: lysine--tRNA ligase [Rickettsiales bacterium]|jgi:lysyl-tRNA synthetase class 2|nr:lysine--tRNA ligase [Rickettsiales bacterium]
MPDDLSEYLNISKTADEQKLKKLTAIKKLGIEPYPHIFRPTIRAEELLFKYADLKAEEHREDEVYSVAGRLMFRRKMGRASFYDLHDESGRVQVYLQQMELSELENALLPNLDIGDFIGIDGYVFRTKTGEISIHCKKIELLSKSIAPMPEKFHGLSDTELRYRQRFIDMTMNPAVRDVFRKRSFIVNEIRNYLITRGFTEVETPVLQPIYGGASARPFVTHHNALDSDLFLRISPELYLKRLIAGGFEKVFDIAKNFRNEGCDATHNPEFTMIEWYEAYTDYNYQMEQVENMIESIVKKLSGGKTRLKFGDHDIDYRTPWKRLSMWDALREYAAIEPDRITKDEVIRELSKYKDNIETKKEKGELLAELFEETCEKHLIAPTFIIDHPVEISPLTKKHRDPEKKGLVERFELFIAQKEVSNSYSELNDPIDQGLRLYEQEQRRKFDEEAQPMDRNFIHCVEFAMPPLGGVGVGIDRLAMLLTNQQSIRDVIAFPIMRPKDDDR